MPKSRRESYRDRPELVGQGCGTTIIDFSVIDRAVFIGSYTNIPGVRAHSQGLLRAGRATITDGTATLFRPNGGDIYNAAWPGGIDAPHPRSRVQRPRRVPGGVGSSDRRAVGR